MADTKKKIELDVVTNVDAATKKFEKLNDVLKKVNRNLPDTSDVSVFGNGMKKVSKTIDSLNKNLWNLGGMTKHLNSFNDAYNKLIKNADAIMKLDEKRDDRRRKLAQKRKALEDEKKFKAWEELAPELESRDEEELALSKREKALKDLTTKRDAAYRAISQITTAFDSGSALNIFNTLSKVGFGAAATSLEDRINKDNAKKEEDYAKQLQDIDRQLSNPILTDTEKSKLKLQKSDIEQKQKNLKLETAEEVAAVKARTAIMLAIVQGVTKTVRYFGDVLKQTTGITVNLKENFNNLTSTVGGILALQGGAATYSSGTTLYTNARARTQQMKYGLTSGQNYALSRTMTMMGMTSGSDEDLMYMNKQQVKLFSAMMNKYSSWYDKMEASGMLQSIQEAQLDLAMLKEEIVMDFMKWFSKNKDAIIQGVKNIAKAAMKVAEGILYVTGTLGKIASIFGAGGSSSVSSTMSMSSGYSDATIKRQSTSNTITINMTNTATGVMSDQNQMQDFFKDQVAKLTKELALQLE